MVVIKNNKHTNNELYEITTNKEETLIQCILVNQTHLGTEKALGSQGILPTAVGEAVVLGLQDREPAGQEQATVEELERGAAGRRLTGVHPNIVQDMTQHGS